VPPALNKSGIPFFLGVEFLISKTAILESGNNSSEINPYGFLNEKERALSFKKKLPPFLAACSVNSEQRTCFLFSALLIGFYYILYVM